MISQNENSSPTTFNFPRSRLLLLLVVYSAAVIVRLILFLKICYTADDALITFRYAENLAAGIGFVYNEGERVLGTTAPLLALVLALFQKLNLNVFVSAFFLNNLADLATSYVLLWMFREQDGPISWLPAVLFLINPETLQWSLSGMETQLYISFLFLGFYFAAKESWIYAFLMAAAVLFLRIDGIALLGALLVTYILRHSRLPAIPLAAFVIAILPWVLFASFYFGSPLPNSAAAKWALAGEKLAAPLEILFRGFLHLNTFGIPILILASIGTRTIWIEKREWLPLIIWTWGYALSYTVAAGPMHAWYYAPFYAGYLAIAFHGLAWLIKRYPQFVKPAPYVAMSIVVISIVLYLSYYRIMKIQAEEKGPNSLNRSVGTWVRMQSKSEAIFAVKDIGNIGYHSRRKILDLAGLVSPQSIPFRAEGDFLGPIRKFRPDYFAFSAGQAKHLNLEHDELMKSYKLAAEIKNQSGTYLIFRSVVQ